MTKNEKVAIIWNDAKLFAPKSKLVEISVMKTIGIVEKETELYYIIKDPLTVNLGTNMKHPNENPTFYLIPKKMVQKIEPFVN